MFLDILNRYFKGVYVPKNTFFEGTKKFSVQKFFGTLCTCTKVACAKNNTVPLPHSFRFLCVDCFVFVCVSNTYSIHVMYICGCIIYA